MLNRTCGLNPVEEVLRPFIRNSLLWMGSIWLWLFAEAPLSLILSGLFTTVQNCLGL